MQATITYLLTEQAQRAQMATTGQPVARKQIMTIEVAPEDLELFSVDEDGNAYLDFARSTYEIPQCKWLQAATGMDNKLLFPAVAPDMVAILRDGRAKVKAEQKEREERAERERIEKRAQQDEAMRAFIADPNMPWISNPRSWVPLRGGYTLDISTRPSDPLVDEYRRVATERMEAQSKREQAAREQREAADAAKERAKTDYIDAWVREHGDELTRQQHADGLLPRKEALALIADAAMADLPGEYDPGEFCQDRDCPCGRKDIDTLPRKAYEAWLPIKAKLPQGAEVEFERVRECLKDGDGYVDEDTETAGPPVYAALLKVPVGPFVFERLVLIG